MSDDLPEPRYKWPLIFIALCSIGAALAFWATGAHAQQIVYRVVATCGSASYSSGTSQLPTQDVNGNACTNSSGGGGSAVNATIVAPLGAQTAAASVATTVNGSVAVTGTFWQTTQPVSEAAAPPPTGVTTTPVGGTVTTHGTFQTALASSGTRKGCLVQNTSTDIEYVFFGANGSATTATSLALGAASVAGGQGGAISCSVGGLNVATDNIAITSKTADGSATYVVYSQ